MSYTLGSFTRLPLPPNISEAALRQVLTRIEQAVIGHESFLSGYGTTLDGIAADIAAIEADIDALQAPPVIPPTLIVNVTSAINAAVTATLPAVSGFKHKIQSVVVSRHATAASAAVALQTVSISNLSAATTLRLAGRAFVVNDVVTDVFPFGEGLVTAAPGATAIVAPARANVTTQLVVFYSLTT